MIQLSDLPALQIYIAETFALLVIHFPHAFFNVMEHLLLHVPRELYWCGPVHVKWMYSVERYLGHLKGLVWNKARPEESIVMGYMYKEALGFITEHFRLYPLAARLIWDMDEVDQDIEEVLEGRPRHAY